MTEEFDEEVVFENSPLFQYLQDLGHTDFEACPTVSQEEEQHVGVEEEHLLQDVSTSSRVSFFWRLADAMWSLGHFCRGIMSNILEQQLDKAFRQSSLCTILEQDVLLQEDVELIELLDPSILCIGSSSTPVGSSATTLLRPRSLATLSFWDISAFVALLALLLGVRTTDNGLGSVFLVPLVLLLMSLMLLRGSALWRTARLQRVMWKKQRQLEQLAQNSRALTGLVRKSLRLIQETEVISRGFTLVSAACPFNKAGQQRSQQLVGLRKACYRALRSAFREARLATCHMLKSYPLNSEIDNVTNYVSTVPLKELGLGLAREPLSDEQAQELTDDYSLPALKVLFQLWVGQSSEFFRRLALLLSPDREEERDATSSGLGGSLLMHQVIAEVTGPFHRGLSCALSDLQRSYDFHRYFEMQLQSPSSDRVGRARQKCHELNCLHTCVRSLQLHLKALLNEVIILEDELEKLMVARETTEMTCAGYQELQSRLHLLQPHMYASSSCWEETVAQVEKMLRRATDCPGTPETPEERTASLPELLPQPIMLIQDRDPVPEEQELEAYVSDSDSDREWHGSYLDMLSPVERERQQREREESRRVLLELKSVLGLRASEVERQKWKQLLFSDRAAVRPTEIEAPSEPHSIADPTHLMDSTEEAMIGGSNHKGEEEEESTESLPTDTRSELEFSCGQCEVGTDLAPEHTGGVLHYLYDGAEEVAEETEEEGRLPLGKPPTVSVMDRLTEVHGLAALSFNSALAAQAAARSHAFTSMEEQTFGDDEDEEAEESKEEEREQEPLLQSLGLD